MGHIRVSTEEQATNGQSLDAQRAKLQAFVDLCDLGLAEVIVDAGVSAKTLNRPGLQDALTQLRKGAAAGLVIAKLDRLSRSVKDWIVLIDGYFGEKAGKQLFSVADSIDTRTAAGRLVLNVLMSVAQWEREAGGERKRDVLQHKICKGERFGRVRFDFNLADDGGTLVSNDCEGEALRLIRELRAAGESLRTIAAQLNARGIGTREGSPWIHTSAKGILARAA
jgi:DNA invertase Pin-like site-specific DNA recombinase